MALTAKQERFVAEYLIDLNATQAAMRAGYSSKAAKDIGCENLSKAAVQAAITVKAEAALVKIDASAERVLQAIAQIAFGDIRGLFNAAHELLLPRDWDEATAASVEGIDIVTIRKGEGAVEHVAKIKRVDRLKALDMLARHLALYHDKIEVAVTDGLADRVVRAKARGNSGSLGPAR
jgi:phage terminase small subunit